MEPSMTRTSARANRQLERASAPSPGILLILLLVVLSSAIAPVRSAPTQSKRLPLVQKWGRFEQAFKSKTSYANPLQDATLTVTFISPRGETSQVSGFWDGDKVW